MSRWSKNKAPIFALPVETPEKENKNRPSASRTAGTMGKWGITSFTSMRAIGKITGLENYSVAPHSNVPYVFKVQSPPTAGGGDDEAATAPHVLSEPVAPKPRKFFKSRITPQQPLNSLTKPINQSPPPKLLPPGTNCEAAPVEVDVVSPLPIPVREGAKRGRKPKPKPISPPTEVIPETYYHHQQQQQQNIEPAAIMGSPAQYHHDHHMLQPGQEGHDYQHERDMPAVPSKRYLARRARKAVNYNEEAAEEPQYQPRATYIPPPLPPPAVAAVPQTVTISPPRPSPVDHSDGRMPIVIRISKGTSRLISTDSEEANGVSPPQQSGEVTYPPEAPQHSSFSSNSLNSSSSLASLQDDSLSSPVAPPTPPEEEPPVIVAHLPPKRGRKPAANRTITTTEKTPKKTARRAAAAAIKAAAFVEVPVTEEDDSSSQTQRRTTRANRRQQEEEELKEEQLAAAAVEEAVVQPRSRARSPQPGSDAYELYRTLASTPDEDVDAEEEDEDEPEDDKKVEQRQELMDVNEEPSVETEIVPIVPEKQQQQQQQKPVPGKRGRKKKDVPVAVQPDQSPEEPIVSGGKIPAAEAVGEEPPPVKVAGRRGRKPKAKPEPVPIIVTVTPEKSRRRGRIQQDDVETTGAEEIVVPKAESESLSTPRRRSARGAAAVTPIKDDEMSVGAISPSPPPPAPKMDNSPKLKQPPVVKSYSRKRKLDQTAPATTTMTRVNGNVDNNNDCNFDLRGLEPDQPSSSSIRAMLFTDCDVDVGGQKLNAMDEDEPGVAVMSMDKPSVKLVISKKKGSIFKSRALASNDEVVKNRPVYKHKWDIGGGEESRNSPGSPSAASEELSGGAKSQPGSAFDGDFDDVDSSGGGGMLAGPSVAGPSTSKGDAGSSSSNNGGLKKIVQKPTTSTLLRPSRFNTAVDFDDNHETTDPSRPTTSTFGGGSAAAASATNKRQEFYTVVRNVKQAHQIQEIGEFQEMDDDVEYILDTLQPRNPIVTRCLSAIQLSTKCMTAAFRMHVRAHGTVTKFFRALKDATIDQSLGLCTATIMFVLSQDNMTMDLDRDSLELMLNLLESDVTTTTPPGNALEGCGLTQQQLERNRKKVRELCEEVKSQGKGVHLNLDSITMGTLAMETLLSLTSKRAGEWFKEELRNLGGLEHIIKTVCECCRQISDYVAMWTEGLMEKLRKIERCLRVLENVMEMNEQNQSYILTYDQGNAINTLVKLYKLCDTEIALYPTTGQTPKDSPGVVIREALVPTLKVLIALTHPFNDRALGALVVGEKVGIFDTSLHLLLHSSNYVPENCIFELSLLVLLLLINLTMHTIPNRTKIMEANALSDFGSQFDKVPAIKALIEFFYKCEESARLAEENTDALLDSNPKKQEKNKKGDDVEETVTKILQKAGNHMEHTIMASYVCLLVGHLIMDNDENQARIRAYLRPDAGFGFLAKILEKYYNFLNLTASSEASAVAHINSTKKIIDYLQKCDQTN